MLPQETRLTPPAERTIPPVRLPAVVKPLDSRWLSEYEERKDSIFRYYSVENEIGFLRKTEALPAAERQFYVDENVKRFLGEFVGKIPYTHIPYMIHPEGFSYGGMHVMDSYRKAAEMGQAREKAETAGFGAIEDRFRENLQSDSPQTAVWISPPKIADYGFVFILQPEENGRVKEYIVRYDERQEEVDVSNRILEQIRPGLRLRNANEFLAAPQFLDAKQFSENLPALLKTVGVNEREINRSAAFESAVDQQLGTWISTYTDLIIRASLSDPPPRDLVNQAKSLLLAIYSQAGRLKEETGYQDEGVLTARVAGARSLDESELAAAYLLMQQNAPKVERAGSCPVVQRYDGFPGDAQSFISNADMLRALEKGETIEDLIRKKSFPCPQCGKPIPAGEGKVECPHCHITKDQYAAKIGGQKCD